MTEIKVQKKEFKGKEYVDIRKYFKGKDGSDCPTTKGIMIPLPKLSDIISELEQVESA